MSAGGRGERVEIVTPFKERDNASARMPHGQRSEFVRHPGIVAGLQLQFGERIVLMRIEACRDDQQLWREGV